MTRVSPVSRFLIAALVTLAAGPVLAAPPGIAKTAKGEVLVSPKGMSLYTYDKDSAKGSACVGDCASKWPPLKVAKGDKAAKGFTQITRADGTQQWAYKGKALYGWVNDKKPGDTSGDGVGGVWHLAHP